MTHLLVAVCGAHDDNDKDDDKACFVETHGKHDVRIAKRLDFETVSHPSNLVRRSG